MQINANNFYETFKSKLDMVLCINKESFIF